MNAPLTTCNHKAINLAMGRIFGMMQRSERPGDVAEYMRCRNLILDLVDGQFDLSDDRPDYGRDRLKGAAGD